MFLSNPSVNHVERIRAKVDPVQSELIAAHVTLCREDEIEGMSFDLMAARIAENQRISLEFGRLEVFSGHGLMLRCTAGQRDFLDLRSRVLGKFDIRDMGAHITLAHPRNPKAPGNSPEAVDIALPLVMTFDRVVLVEQIDIGARWTIITEFPFAVLPDPPNQALEPTTPGVTLGAPGRASRGRGSS